MSGYCALIFFSSGPVLYHTTAAQGAPPVPFSLLGTVLSLHGKSVTLEINDFVSFTLFFPLSVFTVFHGP